MTLFDAYVFIDWSSKHGLLRQNPCADGIWVGECAPGTNSLPKATYHRSRHGCISAVLASLLDHLKHQDRVLVGFDFPYGYPAGWCRALGLESERKAAWLVIWDDFSRRIKDTPNNENNRFTVAHDLNKIAGQGAPGPFWGCPAAQASPNMKPRSPGFPFPAANGVNLSRLRIVETCLQGVQEVGSCLAKGVSAAKPWLACHGCTTSGSTQPCVSTVVFGRSKPVLPRSSRQPLDPALSTPKFGPE